MVSTKPARPAGGKSAVQHLLIDADHSGQRLDNFLISQLKGVPKTHIYRLVRKGEVRINKGRGKPEYRLKEGDIVRIPPIRGEIGSSRSDRAGSGPVLDWLEQRILYEDDSLIAVDKPSGLAVHGGSGVSLGLIEALRRLRPHTPMLELVHRLDRDTSGCLLIAKKRASLLGLHTQLRDGQVDKRYLALIQGVWAGKARQVEAPLEKYLLASGERRVDVRQGGKESASRFSPQRVFRPVQGGTPAASLMEIQLLTGRTHQARVHAAHIGHPIAGDDKYGDKDFNRHMREFGLRRLFLHAARLTFTHPKQGHRLELTAPLSSELQEVLAALAAE